MISTEKLRRFGKKIFTDEPREGFEDPYKTKWSWLARKRILVPLMVALGVVIFFGINYAINYLASGVIASSFRATIMNQAVPATNHLGLMVDVVHRPLMSLFALMTACTVPTLVALHIRSVFKPLTDTFTQDTTQWATDKELEHDYVDEIVTITKNKPWPALLDENIVGIPVHRFKQTPEEKVAHKFRLAISTEKANEITLAHTRAGKEVYFISPTLYVITGAKDQRKRSSIIYIASAGTEPRKWFHMLKSRGYRIRVINTVDPSLSDPYPMFDPFISYYTDYYNEHQKGQQMLVEAGDNVELRKQARVQLAHADKWLDDADHEINSLANMIIPKTPGQKDDFWIKAPRGLFKAVAFALVEQSLTADSDDEFLMAGHEENFTAVNGYTISTLVNHMINERITALNPDYLFRYVRPDEPEYDAFFEKYQGKSALEVYFGELPESSVAKQNFYSMQSGADAPVTISNIVQSFNNKMAPFLRSGIAKMTAGKDDFKFDDLGYDKEKPTALFIMLSTTDTENNELGLLAVEQVFRRLDLRAYRSDQEEFDRRVDLFDDEAGTIGRLIDIQNKWTGSLKRRFFMHLIFQSISQINEMYGKEIANTLLGSAGIINFIRTGETEGNNYIKDRLGKRANYDLSRQRSTGGFHASNMEKVERIPMLDNFELTQLREGESVILRLMHTTNAHHDALVQRPIRNSFETDTNLFPIYKWADLTMVDWDQLHLNNNFLLINRESMNWILKPNQDPETKTEQLEERSDEELEAVATATGTEEDQTFSKKQPTGRNVPEELPIKSLNGREDWTDKLLNAIGDRGKEPVLNLIKNQDAFDEFKKKLGYYYRNDHKRWQYASSIQKVSISQLIDFVTTEYPLEFSNELYNLILEGD